MMDVSIRPAVTTAAIHEFHEADCAGASAPVTAHAACWGSAQHGHVALLVTVLTTLKARGCTPHFVR